MYEIDAAVLKFDFYGENLCWTHLIQIMLNDLESTLQVNAVAI